jgi:HD-like signal output (HDOD) protein
MDKPHPTSVQQSGIAKIALPPPGKRPSDRVACEFLSTLVAELGQGPLNLPCFPEIVPRIREVLSGPDNGPEEIVRVVGTEPRLSARLLQIANSAAFNRSGKPLSNLRRAVELLGHHLIESVVMALAMAQAKAEPSLRTVAKPLGALWEKSVATASICQLLAERLGVPKDKVFLTGLLHGIGHFYILVRGAQQDSTAIEALLGDYVINNHPLLGRAVMEKWGFEPVICEAIGDQRHYKHQPRSRRGADITDTLVVSVLLADALIERRPNLQHCADVTSFATLRLSGEEAMTVLRHTEHTLGSLREALAL